MAGTVTAVVWVLGFRSESDRATNEMNRKVFEIIDVGSASVPLYQCMMDLY